MSLIPAILICCFSNSFCIFFTFVISLNIICSRLSLFSFNSCYPYLIIIFCLIISNIIILDRFGQLIQVLFIIPGSFSRAFIFYFLYKYTFILYNSTNLYCIKLQALLFSTKLLFFIVKAINISV